MRIEKIILKNYRQFRKLELSFYKKSQNDLFVVIGLMGTGKTNILNAINWCFYGDEPHLSEESHQLPLLNLKTIKEAGDGEDKDVIAEIWIQGEDEEFFRVTRKSIFRVYKESKNPSLHSTFFRVKATDRAGNTEIIEDEAAQNLVDRFVPKGIREYSFFDGDRLDRYFKEATGQKIQNAIFRISQVDLIDNVNNRLNNILKEKEKEAAKLNPDIKRIMEVVEKYEYALKTVEEQISTYKGQITIAKSEIKKIEENLKGVPDIEKLEVERVVLGKKKKAKKYHLDEKTKERRELLFEYATIIMSWSAMKKTLEIVEEKRKNKEIPPTFDICLLENIKQKEHCIICGRDLDKNAKKHVSILIDDIKLSSIIATELMFIESSLRPLIDKIKSFKSESKKVAYDIDQLEKDLSEIEKRINQVNKELYGFDSDKIKYLHKKRMDLEKSRDANIKRMGMLEGDKKGLQKDLENSNRQVEEGLKKEKIAAELQRKIDFCSKALNIIKKIKKDIMEENRNMIEEKTKRSFQDLMWKKKTYEDIKIDQDYNLSLIHTMGYECLGTLSSGEREVLTLAFTIALHDVSGFDSSIIVDRPLAMVSGPSLKEITNIFSEISRFKQIILFLTPRDYTGDVSKILDHDASARFNLIMHTDESETKLEEL